ncbi:MAG: deoxyribonuclease V [Desulfurivibrionaceae bacterium]|nr:deoxyribonuclease V [Desulfobacterales bacterium]MDT8334852.1 deoxyribonuclease V [Desulfurivibrionaceae bacterium]
MRIGRPPHNWVITPRQAIAVQNKLSAAISRQGRPRNPGLAAGLDAAFTPDKKRCIGGVVLWNIHDHTIVERHTAILELRFPYIPGLLSFRETPALIAALRKLRNIPDLIICDGQGVAHPRRLGIASHIGLIADLPTIGCAKSRLIGDYREPDPQQGASSPLRHNNELIGAVLRTRDNVKPVFVSVGHNIELDIAVRIILDCAIRYRLPEPTRLADRLVAERKKDFA